MKEDFNEAEYISGFNKGYLLTKEFPEIADILSNATGNSDKLDGMKDGRQQYLDEILEKNITVDKSTSPKNNEEYRPIWLSGDRLKNEDVLKDTNKEKGMDLDKD